MNSAMESFRSEGGPASQVPQADSKIPLPNMNQAQKFVSMSSNTKFETLPNQVV
jgi:hypothetical protein